MLETLTASLELATPRNAERRTHRGESATSAVTVSAGGSGANWYIYCNNNPLSMVDPTGLFPVDPKIVFSPSNPIPQRTFDERYGFGGPDGTTESCKTVALLNWYVAKTAGGVSVDTLDKIVAAAREVGAFNKDGSPHDLNALSMAAAPALERSTYYSLVYPGGSADTKKVSEVDFAYSKYQAGIESLINTKTLGPHYILAMPDRGGTQDAGVKTVDSVDPNRPAAKDYEVNNIEPLQELKLPKQNK